MGEFFVVDSSTISNNNMEAVRFLIIVDNLDCFNKIIAVERYHISIQEEFGNPFSFINSGLISEKAATNVPFSEDNSQGSCALSSNADGSYIPRKQLNIGLSGRSSAF